MANWQQPTEFQLRALHEALLFAYPTPANFTSFLLLRLGKAYGQYAATNSNYFDGLTDVLQQAVAGGWLATLVQRALQDKPNSPKLRVLDQNFELTAADVPDELGRTLEDIVRSDGDFQDLFPWVAKLSELGQQTCRIEYPVNTARGTGWLVGPDLLLTNWHVIDAALPGGTRNASEYVCRFDYRVTPAGAEPGMEVRFAPTWCLDFSPASEQELGAGAAVASSRTLDYALVRLSQPVGKRKMPDGRERGWAKIDAAQPLPAAGSIAFVIQHPDGLPVKLAAGTVSGIGDQQLRIFHTCNTKGGSSGSMLVDAKLRPMALHHAGDVLYHRGKLGAPERNQAVPIGCIASRLRSSGHWP